MGTEVLCPHDCLARSSRRPLRPAGGKMAARRGHGASGADRRASAAAPRQVRTKVAAAQDAYAGPAFGAMAPSPRALPLPRFPSKPTTDVDDSATRELRRLLGLY